MIRLPRLLSILSRFVSKRTSDHPTLLDSNRSIVIRTLTPATNPSIPKFKIEIEIFTSSPRAALQSTGLEGTYRRGGERQLLRLQHRPQGFALSSSPVLSKLTLKSMRYLEYLYTCQQCLLSKLMWLSRFVGWGQNTRVILIFFWYLEFQFLHGFKLFHLVSDFQNSFCFWCTTLPSAVCKIFRLQWEFQWENDQNQ